MGKPACYRGINLIEVTILAIVVMLVLAFFLAPIIHSPPLERTQRETCTCNQRLIARAITMYVQDHHGNFPGISKSAKDGQSATYTGWTAEVLPALKQYNNPQYQSTKSLFYCTDMSGADISEPVSYGYSAQLLQSDGSGIHEKQVLDPAHVGAICDADPGIAFANGGGIVGGYGLALPLVVDKPHIVTPTWRHNRFCIVAYADGHAHMEFEEFGKDGTNGVTRAFYLSSTLGYVNNPTTKHWTTTAAKSRFRAHGKNGKE